MRKIQALIAAAGKGTRSGLSYPKTLYEIDSVSILRRLIHVIKPYSSRPVIVVSPSGEELIKEELHKYDIEAETIVQTEPKGMGDAVLCYEHSNQFSPSENENILLLWGDLPFIQQATIDALVNIHFSLGNDFSLVTKQTFNPYTIIERDASGKVMRAIETRENHHKKIPEGERDIGVFLFNRDKIFEILKMGLPASRSKTTGEHGFLYSIEEAAIRGARIGAYPLAMDLEDVSLNFMSDLSVAKQNEKKA